MNNNIQNLINVSESQSKTSKDIYNQIYKNQVLIIFQSSFAVLIGMILSQYLQYIFNLLTGDNFYKKTVVYLVTCFLLILTAAHLFSINKLQLEQEKILSIFQ